MSEQDGTQASAKRRRSHQTRKQMGRQAPAPQRPVNDNKEGWEAYWKAQGQLWRTEPEIDAERQTYLAERRRMMPDIERGIYPFQDIKLHRADVEWLLATHEKGRGPVDWNDATQRNREGLDVRGADLSQEDLRDLPLACMQGGLAIGEWLKATEEQRNMAAARLKEANLREAQLQEANLTGAQLQGADLREAQLQGADLSWAQLQNADLRWVQLQHAYLTDVTLADSKGTSPPIADAQWDGVNLSVVDWSLVKQLGDEYKARQSKRDEKMKDEATRLEEYKRAVRANRQLAVVLRDQGLNEEADHFAYRAHICQRSVLRRQGWRSFGRWLGSWFLALLAGYGYRPGRTVLWYVCVIGCFAFGYFWATHFLHAQPHPLAWYEALILSVSSFHGRGFFQPVQNLGDPVAILASIEAILGLIIEISFIATFTQRFFGR